LREAIKNEVKDEIGAMFGALGVGEFMTHREIITSNPKIMQAFYLYEYTFSNHKTVPYLRRLCREVTKDGKYHCGHIASFRILRKSGGRWKKYWAWGYPDAALALGLPLPDDLR
jgi:hypothetical protein